MADVKAQRIEWIWEPYIPAGCLTLLDGDPGQGKSQITLDLAARITTGRPMHGSSKGCQPRVVILLNAEDPHSFVTKPRLLAAGADLSLVRFYEEIEIPEKEPRPISLPEDIPVLEDEVKKHRARLVVIDPLMAYLSGRVKANQDHDIRRALHPLAKMAERTGAAVVVVRHLNKMVGTSAMYRGGGSIGITGAARSVLLAGEDKKTGRRVMAGVKNNLVPTPPALGYQIVSVKVQDAGQFIDAPRVQWSGEVQGVTAEDLVAPQPSKKRSRPTARQGIEDLLTRWTGGAFTVKEFAKLLPDYDESSTEKAVKAMERDGKLVRSGKKPGKGGAIRYELAVGNLELRNFGTLDEQNHGQ
jgi:hypothetical protein